MIRLSASESPPEEGEEFSKIADDFQSLILPGTHDTQRADDLCVLQSELPRELATEHELVKAGSYGHTEPRSFRAIAMGDLDSTGTGRGRV